MVSPATRLADLANLHPSAPRILHGHGLDYCCGGHASLASACAPRRLDPEAVLKELAALPSLEPTQQVSWVERPVDELIEHILRRYHDAHKRDLPMLLDLADKVERVHAGEAACPVGLTEHLATVYGEVQQHLAKEELVLFPMLLSGRNGLARAPISVLSLEHDDHGANLRKTRALTNDLTLPPDACASWQALYRGLAAFEAELMQHIHLENHVLFPAALRQDAAY